MGPVSATTRIMGDRPLAFVIREAQRGKGIDAPEQRLGGPTIEVKDVAHLLLGHGSLPVARDGGCFQQVAGQHLRRGQRDLSGFRNLHHDLHPPSA